MAEYPGADDPELDAWLAELGGDDRHGETAASDLRRLLLEEQGRHEAEFDEMRQRRLRKRLQDDLGTAEKGKHVATQRWARPLTLAASVFVVVAAGLFANQVFYGPGSSDDAAWVYSYGDLQRTRGEANVLRADVNQPDESAQRLGIELAGARIPFEMTARDDGTYRLELRIADVNALGRANTALHAVGISVEEPGFYILIVS